MNKKKLLLGFSSAAIIATLSLSATAAQAADVVYGDANCDGVVSIADASAIFQNLANPDKYPLSEKGMNNADVYNRGDGITVVDGISIQRLDAKLISTLPESWKDGQGTENPVTAKTLIHLNGDSATVEGDYAEVNGGVITISHSGEFWVDGTLADGQINVNIADEVADAETVKIFLNGANITSKSAPAILITNAENTSVNIVDGTENTISDGDTAYAGDWLGAAVIEAKDDITFKGGEKEFAANMFFDGTNRIFKGCLIPGASIGVHTHDDSCEVIFILSGNGRLYEKGSAADDLPEYKDVTAGDCLYCPKGHTHSLMNPESSESDLIFYAVVPKQ